MSLSASSISLIPSVEAATNPKQFHFIIFMLVGFYLFVHGSDFIDVTLACDGGHARAHKVVLASYSTFSQILMLSGCWAGKWSRCFQLEMLDLLVCPNEVVC